MPLNGQRKQGVIFEFTQLGNCIKVVAIDTITGLEVTIMGPKSASQTYLERTALAKLRYVLKK
tara:strand:- start:1124 stop:1312 length:189 start_codon:yes stop_codon:yes gene_type:complete